MMNTRSPYRPNVRRITSRAAIDRARMYRDALVMLSFLFFAALLMIGSLR